MEGGGVVADARGGVGGGGRDAEELGSQWDARNLRCGSARAVRLPSRLGMSGDSASSRKSEKGMPMIVGSSRRLLRSDTSSPRQQLAQSYASSSCLSSSPSNFASPASPRSVRSKCQVHPPREAPSC